MLSPKYQVFILFVIVIFAGAPLEGSEALDAAEAKAIEEKSKGKAPKVEAEDSEDEEEDFDADEEESDDGDDSSSSGSDEEEGPAGEDELEDLATEAAEPGSSKGTKRKQRSTTEEDEAQILEGLSGDEVDPGLILAAGRRGRQGRGGAGASRPKYTAKAQVDTDEDEW